MVQAQQTMFGGDPNCAVGRSCDRSHQFVAEQGRFDPVKPAGLEVGKSFLSSDPERPIRGGVEGRDKAPWQTGRVVVVKDGELNAIEAGEAAFGAQPEVSVARLSDGLNRILGKTVLDLPNVVAIDS